jgi:superfamily II DNA/RNA helicase
LPSFSAFALLPTLTGALKEQGIVRPTDIQQASIASLLRGQSLLGVAETGSGKTLAYVLPLLHQLKALEEAGDPVTQGGMPRGLVVVPGRELGEQVAKVLKSLTHSTRLRVRSAIGGSKKKVAKQSVAGNFEILVATPGRLTQLLRSGELALSDVRTLIFDEADQMIDPGFLPVARRILEACPREVQLVMFAATLPGALDAVVDSLFPEPPEHVRTRGSQRVVPTLTTINRDVQNGHRLPHVMDLLGEVPRVGTMLFVNTKEQVKTVAGWLDEVGITYVAYAGQMERQQRRINLAKFRDGEVSILIATDLGGRGLDIELVERVINVHLPQDVDNYLHRVGRTARAGRTGLVVNLVTRRDTPLMNKLERKGGSDQS